jgi:SAM-dependent methyltransferase
MNGTRMRRVARRVGRDRLVYSCGCVNEVAGPCRVLRRVGMCPGHRAGACDPAGLGESYYAENHAIEGGSMPTERYVGQLVDALGPIPPSLAGLGPCLEIGSGASPYAPHLVGLGFTYIGADVSRWANAWMRERFPGPSYAFVDVDLERSPPPPGGPYGFVLAAHSLEHLGRTPDLLREVRDSLAPGGELWVVVPDDQDPLNPDHVWTFTPDSLGCCVRAAGLDVLAVTVRRHVEREKFIYLRAGGPS